MIAKFYRFYDQVKQEVNKVVWPKRQELLALGFVVVGAVFLFSIICLTLDYASHTIVRFLLNLGK